jgi:hypothetical protein
MTIDRNGLKAAIIQSLTDLYTGPLSDTPYVRAEMDEDEYSLLLFRTQDEGEWGEASIDVEQLAGDICAYLSLSAEVEKEVEQ